MKTIWIDLLIALFLVGSAIIGYKKGMVRMLVSFASLILTFAIVWFAGPYVKTWVKNHTKLEEKLQTKLEERIEKRLTEDYTEHSGNAGTSAEVTWTPEGSALLEKILKVLSPDESQGLPGSSFVTKAAVRALSRKLAERVADTVLSLIVYLGLYVAVRLLLLIAASILGIFTKLPLLREANGLAGGLVGAAEGVLLIEALFLIIRLASDKNAGGTWLTEAISRDPVLSWLYVHNLFLYLFPGKG